MTENKLPEGVGKKIVEALRKQSETESVSEEVKQEAETPQDQVQDVQHFEPEVAEHVSENEVVEEVVSVDSEEDDLEDVDLDANDGLTFDLPDNPVLKKYKEYSSTFDAPFLGEGSEASFDKKVSFQQAVADIFEGNENERLTDTKTFTMPANVVVLRRLIAQVPKGVTKQTGAQIIRQTMEALGISMDEVLQEAQQLQESLNDATKDCVATIQEYNNNIRVLEKQVQDYQKQVTQLNDLISLFILTDR